MKNKGFILLDALVCVWIVSLLAILVCETYCVYEQYEKTIVRFSKREDQRLSYSMNGIRNCECELKDE